MDATTEAYGFKKDRLYRPQDDKMREIASVGQLAWWRHSKRGLPYHRIAGNIYYSGNHIIRYLNEQRVEPRAFRCGCQHRAHD